MSRATHDTPFPSTQGYAAEASQLLHRYESVTFAQVHDAILHLVPRNGEVLDIGAGTGRDAAALAAMGNHVLAVEPTAALREGGRALHSSRRIDWLDDGLPELAPTLALGRTFDLVLMTAVWMHLGSDERRAAIGNVAQLIRPGGMLAMTLRHGPIAEGRRMFDISGDETIALAAPRRLRPIHHSARAAIGGPNKALGVTWTQLVFVRD